MITPGKSAYLFHYSKNIPYRCRIENANESEEAGVSINKEDLINFSLYDPIVLCFFDNGNLEIYSCCMENINADIQFIELKTDPNTSKWVEKREYERYPVSLYADVRASTVSRRGESFIKNISYSGMLIYTKSVLPENEEFDIDVYADKKVLFLKAKIVRSAQNKCYNEYGLQIVYSNYAAIEGMKQFVESLKVFHKKVIEDFEALSAMDMENK